MKSKFRVAVLAALLAVGGQTIAPELLARHLTVIVPEGKGPFRLSSCTKDQAASAHPAGVTGLRGYAKRVLE